MDEKQQLNNVEVNNKPMQGQQSSFDRPKEIGGPKGPEPTRYGDWEKSGRCIDF